MNKMINNLGQSPKNGTVPIIVLISPAMVTTNWTPRKVTSWSPGIPTGLLSIGNILIENEYHVKILDGFLGKIDMADELNKIDKNNTLFVGISAMTPQLPSAIKAADIIRKKSPDVPLIWGGIHPTLFPKEVCADSLVDVVVIGEGEYACLELADAFSGSRSLSTVKGIMFKDSDGKVVFTGLRKPINLDDLPFPKYELFNMEDYLYRPTISQDDPSKGNMVKLLNLHTGMGCPFKCTFCINTTVYRDGEYYQKILYRGKSATKILDEIEVLIDKYKVEHINFVDDCFLVDKKRLFQLLDGIEERKLKFTWSTGGMVHYINDGYLSKDVLKRMRNLGCIILGFGAESGSQKVLDYIKKNITIEQVENAAKILNDNKIVCEFSFITGLPQESLEDMFKTIDFIRKLKKIGKYVMLQNPQLYRPYPGCELYDESVKLGFEAPRNIREWTTEKLQEGGRGSVKIEHLPWLKNNYKKLTIIRYTTNILFWNYGRSSEIQGGFEKFYIKRLIHDILRGVFWIRRKSGFWLFPVEYYVFNLAKLIKKVYREWKIS